MTRTLDRLKDEAEGKADHRYHILSEWKGDNKRATAQCVRCHMEVQVIVEPKPNEIHISGEAVALICKG